MIESMIKISVVVPVYNTKEYLEECLDSLIAQTLDDIEIIIVNDGSTDGSADICKKYAKKYNNIKYISQKNQGQSAARNAGVRVAKGEYVGFVDSDDHIKDDMYEFLYNNALRHNVAISACGFMLGNRNPLRKGICKLYNKAEALDYYLLPGYFEIMIWNKIYKKELFDKVQFMPRKITEDVPTIYRLIAEGNGIYYDSTPKYFYRSRPGSVSRKKFSSDEYRTLEDIDEIVKYMEENKLHPKLVYIGWALWSILVFTRSINGTGKSKENIELLSKIRKTVRKHLGTVVFTKALRTRTKFKLLSIFLPLGVYRKIGPTRKKAKIILRKFRST